LVCINNTLILASNRYTTGQYWVKSSQIFFQSNLSYALVNLKPVLPGHILVVPKRCVARFKDLSHAEVSDLWISTQKISTILEDHYTADSLTFAIQDGTSAGQTVSHVHVHVIPRKKGDFENNDDIYRELDKKDRIARSEDDMAKEAAELTSLLQG